MLITLAYIQKFHKGQRLFRPVNANYHWDKMTSVVFRSLMVIIRQFSKQNYVDFLLSIMLKYLIV